MSNTKTYRRVFVAAHGELPHPCDDCGEAVERWGRGAQLGCVHHRDEDRTNHAPSNLGVMHGACHVAHHKRGQSASAETRAKRSASLTGHAVTPATRKKLSAANRGKKASPAMKAALARRSADPAYRAKLSAASMGHPVSDETRAKLSAALTGRQFSEDHRLNMTGWRHSPEAKAKIAAAHRRRSPCPDCGVEYNPVWMTRHACPGR